MRAGAAHVYERTAATSASSSSAFWIWGCFAKSSSFQPACAPASRSPTRTSAICNDVPAVPLVTYSHSALGVVVRSTSAFHALNDSSLACSSVIVGMTSGEGEPSSPSSPSKNIATSPYVNVNASPDAAYLSWRLWRC